VRVVKKSFSGYACEQRNHPQHGSVDGVVQYLRGEPWKFFFPNAGESAADMYKVLTTNATAFRRFEVIHPSLQDAAEHAARFGL
jgi:hypothetical protein